MSSGLVSLYCCCWSNTLFTVAVVVAMLRRRPFGTLARWWKKTGKDAERHPDFEDRQIRMYGVEIGVRVYF